MSPIFLKQIRCLRSDKSVDSLQEDRVTLCLHDDNGWEACRFRCKLVFAVCILALPRQSIARPTLNVAWVSK